MKQQHNNLLLLAFFNKQCCTKLVKLVSRHKNYRSFDSIGDDLLTVLKITCFPCLEDHSFVEVPLVWDDSAPWQADMPIADKQAANQFVKDMAYKNPSHGQGTDNQLQIQQL